MAEALLLKWYWCPHFKEALNTTKEMVICGQDKYWTYGFKINVARVTKPSQLIGQNQIGIILAPLKEYLVGFNPSVLIKTIKQLHGKDEPGDDPTLVENRKKVDEARSVKGVFDIAKSMIVK